MLIGHAALRTVPPEDAVYTAVSTLSAARSGAAGGAAIGVALQLLGLVFLLIIKPCMGTGGVNAKNSAEGSWALNIARVLLQLWLPSGAGALGGVLLGKTGMTLLGAGHGACAGLVGTAIVLVVAAVAPYPALACCAICQCGVGAFKLQLLSGMAGRRIRRASHLV